MLANLKKWLSQPVWRFHMEARVESIEARLTALHERFNRLQSREGMRRARESRQATLDLQDEVNDLLEGSDASHSPPKPPKGLSEDKIGLWKARKGMQ